MKQKNMRRKQNWVTAVSVVVLVFTAACTPGAGAQVPPTPDHKTVTVFGQIVLANTTGETALPDGSTITVQVQDTGRADAPAITLGEQMIPDAKSLPARYQITVDRAALEKPVQASLAVRIEDAEGNLLYINDTLYRVSADESVVDVPVIAVGKSGDSTLPPAFDGQVWQWLSFQDSADGDESKDILVDEPAKYTLELLADGTYAFKADCNIGNGQYTLTGNSLTLTPGAMTLAACGPESLSDRFVALLGDVVTFVFNAEGNLVLNLKMDAGNMIFVRAQPSATPSPPAAASTLLESKDEWRGIGRINITSTCTAVLVDSGAGEAAPAYILTSGHCVEWLANGAITNQKVEGEVLFNYFADTANVPVAIPLAEVVYSTMQGVDIAIIRLDATVGELAAQKIFPFPLADAPLERGSEVRVVGAPSSGLEPAEAYSREELCQINGQVDLLEFNWHFYDHYATSCQDIFGGSSGSPLFSAESHTLYGLINTTVEGSSPCYLGVPCEIGEGRISVDENASYATPVHGLGVCFAENGDFAPSRGCPLPPTSQLAFAEIPRSASQPPLAWDATLAGDLPYYRYKTGAAGVVDCRSEKGYSPTISLFAQPTIPDDIPVEEGFYLLCVLAGKTPAVDDSWQDPAYPTVAIAQIDATPPTMEPQLSVREAPEFFDVGLVFHPPELSDYVFKFGPKGKIDCAAEEDYMRYRRIPLTLERGEGAIRLCVIGFDNANNPTPPLDRVFDD